MNRLSQNPAFGRNAFSGTNTPTQRQYQSYGNMGQNLAFALQGGGQQKQVGQPGSGYVDNQVSIVNSWWVH